MDILQRRTPDGFQLASAPSAAPDDLWLQRSKMWAAPHRGKGVILDSQFGQNNGHLTGEDDHHKLALVDSGEAILSRAAQNGGWSGITHLILLEKSTPPKNNKEGDGSAADKP